MEPMERMERTGRGRNLFLQVLNGHSLTHSLTCASHLTCGPSTPTTMSESGHTAPPSDVPGLVSLEHEGEEELIEADVCLVLIHQPYLLSLLPAAAAARHRKQLKR